MRSECVGCGSEGESWIVVARQDPKAGTAELMYGGLGNSVM